MNIQKNQIDELNLTLKLSIANADYAEIEKKRLAEYRRKADIKGFRKGMVPMSLVQRLYGDQALYEAVNSVISDSLNNFIKENSLRVVGEPLMSESQKEVEWKSGNDFEFDFDLATTPEVDIEPSKEDKLPFYKIEVTDLAKKEMKDNLRSQFGEMKDLEIADEDSFITADLEQDDRKVEAAYISIKSVAADSRAKFIGSKPGDSFELNVNEAFTNESDRAALLKVKKEELAELNPVFKVTLLTVKNFVPAEENQEFFDKVFGEDKVHDSEEFDKAVQERLEDNYKQEADYRLSKELREYLVKKADIALPEEYLKRWLLHVNEGKYTKEDIDKEFDSFLADFRWQMVREALMPKYGLKVEEKDLREAAEAYVSYQFAMYGMPNLPQNILTEQANHILTDEKQVRNLVEQVENQKVITAVKEKVTLQNKKITVEKFRELK